MFRATNHPISARKSFGNFLNALCVVSGLLFFAGIQPAAGASPRLLISEGFDASNYANGVSLIDNAKLGFGYDGAWIGFGTVKILTNSLTYAGYGVDGEQRVQLTNNSAIRRQFLTGNNGPLGNYLDTNGLIALSRDAKPLYLAFLVYSPTNVATGGSFSLFNGDYTSGNRFFLVSWSNAAPFGISATLPALGTAKFLGTNISTTNLVVARFDFASSNDTVKLWFNPATGGAEPAAQATFTNLTIAFDRLGLSHGFSVGIIEFDEIRFGNDWTNTVRTNGLATLPGVQTIVGMKTLPPSPLGSTNFPREFFPFVDAFGQYRHLEWTNKIHSVAELLQTATNELADITANPEPDEWCAYGGWLNGPQLTATGFFRVQKYQNDWWFVDPHGHLFWSHGVTGLGAPNGDTGVTARTNYFANLPLVGDADRQFLITNSTYVSGGYYDGTKPVTMDYMAANALLKYGTNWSDYTTDFNHTRLRSWGMNTIGSWTATNSMLQRRTPYALVLYPYVGGINGDGRMPDYFDPTFATSVTNVVAGPERNDPWCLGFYINNELEWTRPSSVTNQTDVGISALAAISNSYAKIAFRTQLTNKYVTVTALNTKWGTGYSSWTDFLNQRATFPTSTNGDVDLTAFYRNYADQFFRTCGTVVHGYSSNLFLGSRFANSPHVEAARACTNWVDVATYNQYNNTVSIPTGLEADIPVMISEYNFCATNAGLFWGAYNVVTDQGQRAARYTNHFNSAVTNSRFLGTHWFQLRDRCTAGILNSDTDGNNNNGLLDAADTPYAQVITAARAAGQAMYSKRLGTAPPTITAITNRTIYVNTNTGAIAFTIGDDATAAGSLALSRDSSNTNLVLTNNIVFGGANSNRTVTITPRTNQTGVATITLTVTDGLGARGFSSFDLTVLPSNTPPVLAAITNRTLIAGQTLAITNTATDIDLPAQLLTFSLLTNPPGATITTNGLLNWRPTIAQGKSTNPFSVKVADNGSPAMSATQAFTVIVNAASLPGLGNFSVSNRLFKVTVSGDAGPDYYIRATTNLALAFTNWTPVFTNLNATVPFTWTDTKTTNYPCRYYRVLLGP